MLAGNARTLIRSWPRGQRKCSRSSLLVSRRLLTKPAGWTAQFYPLLGGSRHRLLRLRDLLAALVELLFQVCDLLLHFGILLLHLDADLLQLRLECRMRLVGSLRFCSRYEFSRNDSSRSLRAEGCGLRLANGQGRCEECQNHQSSAKHGPSIESASVPKFFRVKTRSLAAIWPLDG